MASVNYPFEFSIVIGILAFIVHINCVNAGSDYSIYLQPDDVDMRYYDPVLYPNICTRPCNGQPKICYYKFHLEHYSVMGPACGDCPRNRTDCWKPQCVTADGRERGILTVNRRMPGPSIQVCKGDTVVIDVKNHMLDKSVTIHWHGIRQVGSPFADGAPFITQCPILPGQSYRYKYLVDKAGTFFWHSHSGLQKVDGINGALIVREPKEDDPNGDLYDLDLPHHVVVISDWFGISADEKIPGFHRGTNIGHLPETYLVNGRGVFTEPSIFTLENMSRPPVTAFRVTKGKRYRFRLTSSTCLTCPVQITIEKHPFKVITTDSGNAIQAKDLESVTLLPGERFDAIIKADKAVSTYWIYVRGLGTCANVNQIALLQYRGSQLNAPNSRRPTPTSPLPSGLILNSPNVECRKQTRSNVCVSQLKGKEAPSERILNGPIDSEVIIRFGFHFYTPETLFVPGKFEAFFEPAPPLLVSAMINNISFVFPESPLLSQYRDNPKEAFCSRTCVNDDNRDVCRCINLFKVPLHAYVQILIVDTAPFDENGLTHPFHLHGYDFYVMEEGIFSGNQTVDEKVRDLQKRISNGRFTNRNPPLKDTVGVPSGGYVVIRFKADNPGFWLIHCHFIFHQDVGMSAVLQVGEPSDFPPMPPRFPSCGSYQP